MANIPPIISTLNAATNVPVSPVAIEGLVERRGFDFRHFWHALLEKVWIVVLCVLAGFFLALGYLARTPKLYQGRIVLEVEFAEPTVINAEDASVRMRSMFLASQEALRTIGENLTNRSLLARVVRTEGFAEDGGRALLGKSAGNPDDKLEPPLRSPAATSTPTEKTVVPGTFTPVEEALGGAITTMVKPVIRRGTRLIDLYVTNRDPVIAQRLAEAIGREYIRNSIERRASFSQDTLRYLLEEEERLKANLQTSEAAVAEYKAKTPDALQLGGGAAATGSQTGAGSTANRAGVVEDQLQELSSKLTATMADRLRLEGELKQVENVGENVDALLAVPSIAAAPTVLDRRRDLAQLEATVATLAQRYKDKHPKMMAAHAALNEARESLRRAVLAQPAVLRNLLEQARATEQNLSDATHDQEKTALALNKASIGYLQLARQAETDRALYESVLRQIKETNLTKDVKANAVSVIEHSPLPRMPVSPSPTKAIVLGFLGCLVGGLGVVFAMDALDRSIRTVDQAEATVGLPVLAAIPETGQGEAKEVNRRDYAATGVINYRLVHEAPAGPTAEAFRNLRAALSLLGREADRKVFLFTSAVPDEGKSFTSVNYAIAVAQQGHRVLLIDGDLRRPSIHKIFPPEAINGRAVRGTEEMPGIIDYLVGATGLKAAARIVLAGEGEPDSQISGRGEAPRVGQLSILAGGRRSPNPAELLSGTSFKELVLEAAAAFDRVIIDSAPILAVSDTLLMVPYVQTTCMVLRAGKTPRNVVNRALSLLAAAGSRPAGLILNRLPRRRGAGYYYYYASPGYGSGEGSYTGQYGQRKTASTRDHNGAAEA